MQVLLLLIVMRSTEVRRYEGAALQQSGVDMLMVVVCCHLVERGAKYPGERQRISPRSMVLKQTGRYPILR
jgi:hypothetical protein